jgi:hypothetical protein
MPRISAKAKAAAANAAANAALTKAREAAASELRLPTSDWKVVRLSTLTSAHEVLQGALAAGERIDFKELLEVDRALADLRKELKTAAPVALKVSFVDSARGEFKCTKCGELNEAKDDAPAAETPVQPADPTPPKAPGSIVAAVPGAAAMSRPQPKVVELKRPSIHDPVEFADGSVLAPPLKRLQGPDLRRYAAGDPAAPFGDNRSVSQFQRDVDASYR